MNAAVPPRPVHGRAVLGNPAAPTPSSPPISVRAHLAPRQPLLYAALSFSAGILLGTRVWRPPTWWTVAILVFLAAGLYLLRRRPRGTLALACGALVLLGALAIQARGPVTVNTEILRFADAGEVMLTAHVTRDGFRREGGFGNDRQVLELESEQVQAGAATRNIRAGLRLTIYARPEKGGDAQSAPVLMPLYTYGQRLLLAAKLRPPRNFGNPGAFDYRGYLAQRGIAALGSANQRQVQVLPGFAGTRTAEWRNRLRRSVLAKIHLLWPPQQAALMDAMVMGEDAFIDRDTRVNFQRSGTYHVLVVSGMNLGILAFVVFWLLRRMRVGNLWASIATALLGFGYAYLCDWGAPIVRSALMLLFYLFARLLYRDRAPANAVGGAALAILILDPRSLLDPSFQLTFLSVLAIAGIGIPLIERTSQPYRRALRLLDEVSYDLSFVPRMAQFRLDLRMIAGRLHRFLGTRAAYASLTGGLGFLLGVYEVMLISALIQVALALPMAVLPPCYHPGAARQCAGHHTYRNLNAGRRCRRRAGLCFPERGPLAGRDCRMGAARHHRQHPLGRRFAPGRPARGHAQPAGRIACRNGAVPGSGHRAPAPVTGGVGLSGPGIQCIMDYNRSPAAERAPRRDGGDRH